MLAKLVMCSRQEGVTSSTPQFNCHPGCYTKWTSPTTVRFTIIAMQAFGRQCTQHAGAAAAALAAASEAEEAP
jgi:hypothetical protein